MKIERPDTHAAPVPDSAARAAWSPIVTAASLAFALELILTLACSWCTISQDEPVILRWIRLVVDHPLRTGMAFGLCFIALRWPATRPSTPTPPLPW